MTLTTQGRIALDQHFANTAKAYGMTVASPQVGQHYAATPSLAQILYRKIVEDGNPFLRQINVLPVSEIKGEKIGMKLAGRVASRTDTSIPGNQRVPKNLAQLDTKGYELFPTEFDVALKYALIDSWSKFPNFAAAYMTLVRQAIGNDILQIGWSGTSHAVASDIATNPLLQDVNIGWLQFMRLFNGGSQYVLGGTIGTAGAVTLGEVNKAVGGYANLSLLAKSMREMLPIYHQQNPDLVLLCGSDVLSYQKDLYYALNDNSPMEKTAMSAIITGQYDSIPAIRPPFFPQSSILLTPLSNLSVYYQDTSVRRIQRDRPEMNEVQDFNSVNEGYVVENEELAVFIENITFK